MLLEETVASDLELNQALLILDKLCWISSTHNFHFLEYSLEEAGLIKAFINDIKADEMQVISDYIQYLRKSHFSSESADSIVKLRKHLEGLRGLRRRSKLKLWSQKVGKLFGKSNYTTHFAYWYDHIRFRKDLAA